MDKEGGVQIMLIKLQCLDCEYYSTMNLSYEDRFEGQYNCEEYKAGIPRDVEDGTGDCPKFVEVSK